MISKEVAESVYGAKRYLTSLITDGTLGRQAGSGRHISIITEKLTGTGKYSKFSNSLSSVDDETVKNPTRGGTIESIVDSEELASLLNDRMKKRQGGNNQRLANMLGWRTKDNQNPVSRNVSSENKSRFTLEKYKFFLEAQFDISNRCCNVMKKQPAHDYHRRTGRNPIIATMASESKLRTQKWLQNGCNGFNLTIPTSTPMSFWTEQDVLLYIKENNLPICSVYGDVVVDYSAMGQCNNQMSFADFGIFDNERPLLKTTGCQRTGCVLCGYGCHLEKEPNRFQMLKETHPKSLICFMS